MRVLRYVGPGDDANHVIAETSDGSERFTLVLDAALREAARAEIRTTAFGASDPVPVRRAPEPTSPVSPRDIQIRVRAGASPEELAEEHGVSLDRIMRFAGPVLDERIRIADTARRARARRNASEAQTIIFGEAVDARFSAHGIDPASVAWDARRRDDGNWQVTATWVGGESRRAADWVLHLSTNLISPLDDAAADLLSDRPIRLTMSEEEIAAAEASRAMAPPLRPGVVAFPVMADTRTGPVPVVEDVFDQNAEAGATTAATTAAADSAEADDSDYDEPLPLGLPPLLRGAGSSGNGGSTSGQELNPALAKFGPTKPAKRAHETDEERAARARVPSWDDILLGVRRKRD